MESFKDGANKYMNTQKCADYFSHHYGCTICVRDCPFNLMGYELLNTQVFRHNTPLLLNAL
ncbi:MAG: hypothetical protein ACRCZB_09785 [Bacteroidales bacterium]